MVRGTDRRKSEVRGGEKRSESRDATEDQAPKLSCCTWCVGVCVWLCLVWLFPCLLVPVQLSAIRPCLVLSGRARVGLRAESGCVGNGPVVWAIAGVFSSPLLGCWAKPCPLTVLLGYVLLGTVLDSAGPSHMDDGTPLGLGRRETTRRPGGMGFKGATRAAPTTRSWGTLHLPCCRDVVRSARQTLPSTITLLCGRAFAGRCRKAQHGAVGWDAVLDMLVTMRAESQESGRPRRQTKVRQCVAATPKQSRNPGRPQFVRIVRLRHVEDVESANHRMPAICCSHGISRPMSSLVTVGTDLAVTHCRDRGPE